MILSIPLAATITVTVEAGLLCLILLWRLRVGIKEEHENLETPASPTLNHSASLEEQAEGD